MADLRNLSHSLVGIVLIGYQVVVSEMWDWVVRETPVGTLRGGNAAAKLSRALWDVHSYTRVLSAVVLQQEVLSGR